MLAIARALMARPRLLMLDEPSLGLAPLIVQEIFRIVRELNEKEGLTVLVVEQNARIALDAASTRLRARGRQGRGVRAERASCATTRPSDGATWATDGRVLPTGRLGPRLRRRSTASLALALVLIHRATGVVNFAQGEMAMFSTYIAWTLTTNHGCRYWPAFAITLRRRRSPAASAIHQAVIRPVEQGSAIRVVIVTIGLLLIAQRARRRWIWARRGARRPEPVPDAAPSTSAASRSRSQDLGTIGVSLAAVARPLARSSSSRRSASRCAPRRSNPARGAPRRASASR